MQGNYSNFNKKLASSQDLDYNLETPVTHAVYRELMAIAQEIEICRASL